MSTTPSLPADPFQPEPGQSYDQWAAEALERSEALVASVTSQDSQA